MSGGAGCALLGGLRRGRKEPLVHSSGIQVSPGPESFSHLPKVTADASRALAELSEAESEVREAL